MIQLHTHDKMGSLLDSILSVEDIVNFAKDCGHNAVAITNHGTMHSYVNFYKYCKKQNIKPIIGCEVYEVDDMKLKNDTKDNKQRRYHLILLAKNEKGYKNLIKIVSEGYLTGFYGKPRIDLDYIESNNLGEGIICLTACMAGRLSRIVEGQSNCKYTAEGYVNRLKSIFDYVSLEIQSHDKEDQVELNKRIIEVAKKTNTSYVMTTDAHMKENTDFEVLAHSVFIQIGTERDVGETYRGCYLQDTDEVHKNMDKHHSFDIVQEAINETYRIADMIEEYSIGLNTGNKMPKIPCPPQYKNNLEWMRSIIKDNFDKKYCYLSEEEKEKRWKRIVEDEQPVLEELEYIDYFLMLVMLTEEAKKDDIPIGYSRGSGGNCQNLYSLGVTQIDSMRWDLDFSRFANLGRRSMAD